MSEPPSRAPPLPPPSPSSDPVAREPIFAIVPARRLGWLWAGAGGAVLVSGALLWAFHARPRGALVIAAKWRTSVTLERKTLHHDEAWINAVPSDAVNRGCQTRPHSTRNCNPHPCDPHDEKYDCGASHRCRCHGVTESLPNGASRVEEVCEQCFDQCNRTVYSTCYQQCPVMADWCHFDHYTWDVDGTRDLSGTVTERVSYADVTPNADERIAKKEFYTVRFMDKDGTWSYAPASESEFHRFQMGSRWELAAEHAGEARPVRPL